jgi:ComF family protein
MRLPFIPIDGCCRKCGCDVYRLDGEVLCEDCREHKPDFDRAVSAVRFEADARKMLHGFKFKRHLWLKDDFADWLEGCARARLKVEEVDLVIPVPLWIWRRINRGYNQCNYLAQALAQRIGKKSSNSVLKRIGSPIPQSSLSQEERRLKVKGTFVVAKPKVVVDKTVLVVDDVMTTGSTFSECSKVLKDAGAKKVWCISLLHS